VVVGVVLLVKVWWCWGSGGEGVHPLTITVSCGAQGSSTGTLANQRVARGVEVSRVVGRRGNQSASPSQPNKSLEGQQKDPAGRYGNEPEWGVWAPLPPQIHPHGLTCVRSQLWERCKMPQ